MTASLKQLEQLVRQQQLQPADRRLRNQIISDCLLSSSKFLRDPNFQSFQAADVQMLYELYDENFFDGWLMKSLDSRQISFRLSRRMTKAGGKTTRWSDRWGRTEPRYEIAISATLLFQSFKDPERHTTVTGLDCASRLEGLMRIMEHELVHLTEMLVWTDSSCALHRFQDIASRLFGHTDHRHDLMTVQEAAVKEFGIRPGVRVRFDMDGHTLEGIVNRITRRATVLVPHPSGRRYSDGQCYLKYYVPLKNLEAVQ